MTAKSRYIATGVEPAVIIGCKFDATTPPFKHRLHLRRDCARATPSVRRIESHENVARSQRVEFVTSALVCLKRRIFVCKVNIAAFWTKIILSSSSYSDQRRKPQTARHGRGRWERRAVQEGWMSVCVEHLTWIRRGREGGSTVTAAQFNQMSIGRRSLTNHINPP